MKALTAVHEYRKNIYAGILKTKQNQNTNSLHRPNMVSVDIRARLKPWARIAAEATKPLREKMQTELQDQKSNFQVNETFWLWQSCVGIT